MRAAGSLRLAAPQTTAPRRRLIGDAGQVAVVARGERGDGGGVGRALDEDVEAGDGTGRVGVRRLATLADAHAGDCAPRPYREANTALASTRSTHARQALQHGGAGH